MLAFLLHSKKKIGRQLKTHLAESLGVRVAYALLQKEVERRNTGVKHEGKLVVLEEAVAVRERKLVWDLTNLVNLRLYVGVGPDCYSLAIIHVSPVVGISILVNQPRLVWPLRIDDAPHLEQIKRLDPHSLKCLVDVFNQLFEGLDNELKP